MVSMQTKMANHKNTVIDFMKSVVIHHMIEQTVTANTVNMRLCGPGANGAQRTLPIDRYASCSVIYISMYDCSRSVSNKCP